MPENENKIPDNVKAIVDAVLEKFKASEELTALKVPIYAAITDALGDISDEGFSKDLDAVLVDYDAEAAFLAAEKIFNETEIGKEVGDVVWKITQAVGSILLKKVMAKI